MKPPTLSFYFGVVTNNDFGNMASMFYMMQRKRSGIGKIYDVLTS